MRALLLIAGLAGCASPGPGDSGDTAVALDCPYPEADALPEQADPPALLRTWCGDRPVETAAGWRRMRRPELAALFSHYVYGAAPAVGGEPGVEVGRSAVLDGAGELVEVDVSLADGLVPMRLTVFRPVGVADAPVVLALNACGAHTLVDDPAVGITDRWVEPDCPAADESGRGGRAEKWPVADLLARGWALATVHQSDLAPDQPTLAATDGVIGAIDVGVPEPDRWGAVAAWAWGLTRAVDHLGASGDVDPDRIVVTGHSRRGKAALLAGALDERIAVVAPHQSGTGGAALSRGDDPGRESVQAVAGFFPHWFGSRYLDFGGQEDRLPVDQHLLLAMVAPRRLLLTDGADDDWAHPAGAHAAAELAAPAWPLLGATGLVPGDRHPDFAGDVAWHVRPGDHALLPEDWHTVLDFAEAGW